MNPIDAIIPTHAALSRAAASRPKTPKGLLIPAQGNALGSPGLPSNPDRVPHKQWVAQSVYFNRAMSRVRSERNRQQELVDAGKHPVNVSDPMIEQGGDHALKLSILGEEFGEVAKEVYERSVFESDAKDPNEKLRTELTHMAAVAVAWLEALEQEAA